MRWLMLLVALCFPVPALSQISNPSVGSSVDISQLMPRSEAEASIAVLQAGINAGANPPVCGSTPAPDTSDGSVGVGVACTPKADAARPAKGLWTTGVTNSTCDLTWTFGKTFVAPVVSVTTQDAGMPVIWNITALSGTAVTLKAYRMRTLPASLTLLTALQGYDVTVSTGASCSGVTAHLGVREKLVP